MLKSQRLNALKTFYLYYNHIMEKKSDIQRYLSAYLQRWVKQNGLTQAEAASRLSINQAQLNGILNLTRGVSIEKMESLCFSTGRRAIDALNEGRELLGLNPKNTDNDGLTAFQRNAVESFKFILMHGGEAAELLADNAVRLATKKQAEYEYQHPQFNRTSSKSA